jgi:hypothetical protein
VSLIRLGLLRIINFLKKKEKNLLDFKPSDELSKSSESNKSKILLSGFMAASLQTK